MDGFKSQFKACLQQSKTVDGWIDKWVDEWSNRGFKNCLLQLKRV